ncbi:MAG TPA: AraC family transcriptional regulator [Terriglobia bacterium]|nr:AraC family transcriptional regulator [Terriglobia bacterium]
MAQPTAATRSKKPAETLARAAKPIAAADAPTAAGSKPAVAHPGVPGGDALSSLAPLLRVRPVFDSLCRFGAQWASGHAPERDGWVPFHLIMRGDCVIDVAGQGAHALSAGDIAILPHGGAHVVRGKDTPVGLKRTPGLRSYPTDTVTVKTNVAEAASDGAMETELVCGRLQFELGQQNLVLAALPPVIVLRADDGSPAAWLQQTMVTIRDELTTALPGALAIANNLASALMVMVLRLHIAQQNTALGLLGLLSQRQAARAVIALVEQPDKAWTLDELADLAGASRATLVRLFQKTAGMAPLEFLTDLRLNLARNKLAGGSLTMAEIAAQIGYQSESAFSRAFTRHFGVAPSSLRPA